MNKTSYSIFIDYKKALKDAELIEHAAKKTMKEASRIVDNCNAVSAAWKGENAEKLKEKLLRMEEKLKKTAKQLHKTAQVVRTIAEATYKSEKAALELAKKRNV